MNRRGKIRVMLTSLLLGVCLLPSPVWACAACFGASDSKLAVGMNWGIFSLLVVVVGVLGTIATFFFYLAKRAATLSATAPGELAVATEKT